MRRQKYYARGIELLGTDTKMRRAYDAVCLIRKYCKENNLSPQQMDQLIQKELAWRFGDAQATESISRPTDQSNQSG